MSEKKELNEEQLNKVTGGDNNDYESEWSPTPSGVKYRYEKDQWVEVYNNGFHVRTTRRQIKDRRPFYYKGGWVGEYKFHTSTDLSGNEIYTWYLADDIQS